MAKLAWIWLALISLFQVAYSKETDRSHWVVPDGSKDGNFLSTYYVGDSIRVEWVGWDSSFTDRLMANSEEGNLYVNAWNSNYSSFVKIISCMGFLTTSQALDDVLMFVRDSFTRYLKQWVFQLDNRHR